MTGKFFESENEILQRVAARGGPKGSWVVDLENITARSGAIEVRFHRLVEGGYWPSFYRRLDDTEPHPLFDLPLLEDAHASMAAASAKKR